MTKKRIVVLAAGRGKRMGGNIPKVVTPFKGRPIVTYLLDAIKQSGVDSRPVIVIGHGADLVRGTLGPEYEYVEQKELLGTGHAVETAKPALQDAEAVLVLFGDHPFLKASTIRALSELYDRTLPTIAMCTVHLPDFLEWRAPFDHFSRVVRDENSKLVRTVEYKDASPEERLITEVNPVFMCFEASWLWENIHKLSNENAQKEYYLTDLIEMAIAQGKKIETTEVPAIECIGINTPEHLQSVENLL